MLVDALVLFTIGLYVVANSATGSFLRFIALVDVALGGAGIVIALAFLIFSKPVSIESERPDDDA